MSKLCSFYVEVKDLKDGDTKVFSCNCKRHKGRDIQVMVVDGCVRELAITAERNRLSADQAAPHTELETAYSKTSAQDINPQN